MDYAVNLRNVTKKYPGFILDKVNLSVPTGTVMGLVGENGAGKSTTLHLMLGLIRQDAGSVTLLGKDSAQLDRQIKEQIGVVMDEACFPEGLTARDINKILRSLYKTWDEEKFFSCLKQFSLPEKRIVKAYSRGMKMKLSIAAALSHNTRLLILDEATAGLDPVVRDEILEIFMTFMQEESHTIVMSSHIVSDLERVCDYIAFLHKGKLIFADEKDVLLDRYAILKCPLEQLGKVDQRAVIGRRLNMFGAEALVEKRKMPRDCILDKAGIEEIMRFYSKEEKA